MTDPNGDALIELAQLVAKYQIRTEYLLTQHEQRIALLEEIQADLRRFLDELRRGR